MFKTHPPLPSAEGIRSFRQNAEAVRAAIKLRSDLSATIVKWEPETLLALARQFFIGEDDYQTIVKFGLEVTDALRALTAHSEDVRSLSRAEKDRVAPAVSAASRRHFEIIYKLQELSACIRRHEADLRKRREALQDAGVSGNDLERLVPADGNSALQAEYAVLQEENEALSRFLLSRDERHLPANFIISAPIKVEANSPLPQRISPLYRVGT